MWPFILPPQYINSRHLWRKKTSFQLTTLQYKLRIFTRFSLGECVNEVQICSLEKWLWGTSSVQGIKFSIVLGNCKTLSLNLSETPYLSQVTTWSNWHFLLCLLLSAFAFALLYSALWCFVHSLLILCSVSLTQLPVLPPCLCPRARYTLHQYTNTQVHQYTSTRWQSATMILHWFAEIRCVFTSMSWGSEGQGGETDRQVDLNGSPPPQIRSVNIRRSTEVGRTL